MLRSFELWSVTYSLPISIHDICGMKREDEKKFFSFRTTKDRKKKTHDNFAPSLSRDGIFAAPTEQEQEKKEEEPEIITSLIEFKVLVRHKNLVPRCSCSTFLFFAIHIGLGLFVGLPRQRYELILNWVWGNFHFKANKHLYIIIYLYMCVFYRWWRVRCMLIAVSKAKSTAQSIYLLMKRSRGRMARCASFYKFFCIYIYTRKRDILITKLALYIYVYRYNQYYTKIFMNFTWQTEFN